MDPNYQQPGQQTGHAPQPTPPTQNPYAFITETQPKHRRSIMGSNSSLSSRILFALGILVVLLIVGSVFSSLLSRSNKGNTQALTALVAEQEEIVRIADLGVLHATDPSTIAYAQTTKLTVQSQQSKLLNSIKKSGVKITPKMLIARKNSKTDSTLTAAKAANRYNSVVKETLDNLLAAYAADLKTSIGTSASESGKVLLASSYESVQLILKN